jgi:hypothetical protein
MINIEEKIPVHNVEKQGSSTFQIVRATLTISKMPAGHKAMTYVYTYLGKVAGASI